MSYTSEYKARDQWRLVTLWYEQAAPECLQCSGGLIVLCNGLIWHEYSGYIQGDKSNEITKKLQIG